ncbi:uncharacterized protein LOC131067145 isoform X1 [Cryptomeria japonica]|uniref:uncharacterized protein LOC131067145 isoform X1 n=1 Tax=Cryptomeria japonica TaxID=3369 RepID=UPI0025AC7C57|nr:uncharacterized protein LOC131067145 isoform X1 [Cryptomeria japonica]XP_057858074.1 uncharacterized protein LOC131067145 isoform X1 [Cryptomeria japonica]XP_057858083.1 uncharacterized protein LOC131067145 isoform X1 [Cryptomeria japonica]XP_057858096.1 uncharacterized protein LOC131067145 isoform X1 [Cryptomeria japonica]
MRTRSANPDPKSDSGKKVPPKKGVSKTPTKTDVSDSMKESAVVSTEKRTESTPGDKVSITDDQGRQTTPKALSSKSGAGDKTPAEGMREVKGNTGPPKSAEKKVTTMDKVGADAKTKIAATSKTKGIDAHKLKSTENYLSHSQVKNSGSSEEKQKHAVKVGQKEVRIDEKVVKGTQDMIGKLTAGTGKAKEDSLSKKVVAEGSESKAENVVESQLDPEVTMESGGEEGEEEVDHEDLEHEGEEIEEYDGEEGYEEAEGEEDEGNYEDAEAGEDELEEDVEQHEIEMPAVVQERRRKKELEVFVGGLDKDAVEEDLRKVFAQVGDVVEVRLLRNPLTNKNKGFAFVGFATTEEAKRAVAELKNVSIRGKRVGVAPSEDNDTLFLGNICKTWTKEAVKKRLKDYGVEGLEEITLVGDTQNEGLSRGFAFLEFGTHMDAMNAYKRLQKPDVIFGGDRTAKVAFAEPLREPDAEVMAQVKSVFVDGLPQFWDEDRVKEHLKTFGEIEKVVLSRNMPTAKRRDFGFVNFASHEQALACIEGLNNTMIIEGETKLKVKVRLANPLPKSQAVKGGMRGGFPIGHTGIGIRTRPGWRKLGVGERYPFKKIGISRGRGFISRGHARVLTSRGGRLSVKDDDDVNDLFRTFREQLIHDERRTTSGRARRSAGTLRRGSYRGYSRQNDAYYRRTSAAARVGEDYVSRSASGNRPVAYKPSYGPRRSSLPHAGARTALPRRQSFPPTEDVYSRRLDRDLEDTRLRPDTYTYEDANPGTKRPYAAVDEHSGYAEPSRGHTRTRYDYSGPVSSGARYSGHQTLATTYDGLAADSVGTGTGLYSSGYAGTSDYYRSDVGGSSYSSLYGGSRTLGGGSYY